MDLHAQRQPLDAPGIPEVDGELVSREGSDGRIQVEVIEHLRVKVPAAARQAWLEAEQASWEPWLRSQVGFLGRELRWDQEREEGQLLIRWASRAQWHAIPHSEIEQVQERFERLAHAALERLGVLEPLPQTVLAEPSQVAASQAEPSPAEPAQEEPGRSEAPQPPPAGAPANPFPLVYSGELPPDALASPDPGAAAGPRQNP